MGGLSGQFILLQGVGRVDRITDQFQLRGRFGRGKINIEDRAFIQVTGRSDEAFVVFYDPLYNRQANAGACVLFFSVQGFKYSEDLLTVFQRKTDAVVLYLYVTVIRLWGGEEISLPDDLSV